LPVAVGLAVFLYVEVHPGHVAEAKNPSWLDEIFANGVVLAFVRIGLIAAAAFVVASIAGLTSEGRWLTELGPAKARAREPIARLDSNVQVLETELRDAVDTIEGLNQRLVESDEALAKAQADIAGLLDYIANIEAGKEGV
jgi:uncharacterized coiled-coil protein SlyX